MAELVKIRARIELFSGEKMRKTPFVSGYRPGFEFMGARTMLSGSIGLIDRESFEPGTSGIVQIKFIKGMIDDKHFKVGEPFIFGEGSSTVGKGEIIDVIEL